MISVYEQSCESSLFAVRVHARQPRNQQSGVVSTDPSLLTCAVVRRCVHADATYGVQLESDIAFSNRSQAITLMLSVRGKKYLVDFLSGLCSVAEAFWHSNSARTGMSSGQPTVATGGPRSNQSPRIHGNCTGAIVNLVVLQKIVLPSTPAHLLELCGRYFVSRRPSCRILPWLRTIADKGIQDVSLHEIMTVATIRMIKMKTMKQKNSSSIQKSRKLLSIMSHDGERPMDYFLIVLQGIGTLSVCTRCKLE